MNQLINFPFQSRYLILDDGTRIHYVDEGEGTPIVLLHGNPTWSFLYRHIITDLKPHFRCIAFDLPGFGLSEVPSGFGFTAAEQAAVALEVVERFELDSFYVMMQDWGGPIGFYVATHLPEQVQGFVIGNTWAWPHNGRGFLFFSRTVGGPIGRLAANTFNGIVHLFMRAGVKSGLSRQDYKMYLMPFQQRKKRKPTHIFPRQLEEAQPFLADVEKALPLVTNKPALLVWGEKDFAFKAEERERFEALFADHQTVLLPEAGHFVQEDAPHEISQAILDWVALAPKAQQFVTL